MSGDERREGRHRLRTTPAEKRLTCPRRHRQIPGVGEGSGNARHRSPKAASVCAGNGRRGAVAGGVQRARGCAPTMQATHQSRVLETHFGFRRMHIDVDQLRRALEEEGHQRVPVARQEILIGAADGALQQPIASPAGR